MKQIKKHTGRPVCVVLLKKTAAAPFFFDGSSGGGGFLIGHLAGYVHDQILDHVDKEEDELIYLHDDIFHEKQNSFPSIMTSIL